MRQTKFGLAPFLWLMFAVISIESRSINHTTEDDTFDEDFDLENALSDYYDSLMELWVQGLKTEEKEEAEDENRMKPKREEVAANHLSGLLSMPQNESENNTKSYFDLTIPFKIGNVTYRFLNESHAALLDRQRTSRERLSNESDTTRIKNLRLNSIKDSVMSLRGGNSSQSNHFLSAKQAKTISALLEKQGKRNSAGTNPHKYVEKSQGFFPSCAIPKSTDEVAWSEPYSMNLFFDINFPAPPQDSALMIVNAVLKLYTVSQTGSSLITGNLTSPESGSNQGSEIPDYGLVNDDDKRIRISVYWHTKSVRRQRIKRRLLDSQMLPLNGENCVSFDIRPAVRGWKESGRNFGLQIIVEDESGTLHRPNDYIHPMNCSKLADSVKPLPLFGFDSETDYSLDGTTVVKDGNKSANEISAEDHASILSVKYPILGLQMRDVSLSEFQNLIKVKSAQMELSSRYNISQHHQRLFGSDDSSKDSSSRITDFENVPLGLPLNQNFSAKQSEDVKLKSVSK